MGEGSTKQWRTETLVDLCEGEGEGWGGGSRGIQDGHYRDFQEGKQEILRRWVWGGLTWVEKIEDLEKRWW